jgi:uncharacterized protein involved in outer membrane biogenesis
MLRKLYRSLATTVITALCAAAALLAAPFLIPPSYYHATLERLLSEGLGRNVHIGALRYQVFPLPHITGSGISVTSRHGAGEAVISKIDLWLDLEALLQKQVAIKRVHFSGLATNQAFIDGFVDTLAAMRSGASPGEGITVQRISASTIVVRDVQNRLRGPFRFDARLGGTNDIESVTLALDDGSAIITVAPLGPNLDIQLRARRAALPTNPPIEVDFLEASGVLSEGSLQITHYEFGVFGASGEGHIHLRWTTNSANARGRVQFAGLDLARVNDMWPTHSLTGTVNGVADFDYASRDLRSVPNDVNVVADLRITNGSAGMSQAALDFKDMNVQASIGSESRTKPSLAKLLENAQLKGEVTLREAHVRVDQKSVSLPRIAAAGEVRRGEASLSSIDAEIFGGAVTASDTQVKWVSQHQIAGRLTTKSVQIKALMALLGLQDYLSGSLTTDAQIALSGPSWTQALADTALEGRAVIQNATINNPGITSLPIKPFEPWLALREVELRGRVDNQGAQLSKARIEAYDGLAQSQNLSLGWGRQWYVKGRIQAEKLPVATTLSLFVPQVWIDGVATGEVVVNLQASNAPALLDHPDLSGTLTIHNGRVLKRPAKPLRSGHGQSWNTSEPVWLAFDKADARAAWHDTRIDVAEVNMHAHGGELGSSNALITWQRGWQISGPLTVSNIALEPLVAPLALGTSLSGRLNGQFAVRLEAEDAGKLLETSRLAGDFYVTDGVVYNTDIENATWAGTKAASGTAKTQFKALSGSISSKEGRTRIRHLHIESNSLTANGEIRIDPDTQLSGSLSVAVFAMGPFTVPLTVAGTLDDPHFRLSAGAMVGGAVGTSVLGPGLGTVVGIQTGRAVSALGSILSPHRSDADQESLDSP